MSLALLWIDVGGTRATLAPCAGRIVSNSQMFFSVPLFWAMRASSWGILSLRMPRRYLPGVCL